MGRLQNYLDYEDYDEPKQKRRRVRRNKEPQPKTKPNKRLIKNLEFHTEKDSQSNVSMMEDMLRKISVPPKRELVSQKKPKSSHGTNNGTQKETPKEELCQILGLKFTTSNEMVLRLFNDPFSVPTGTVFYIKDAYINGEVELVQILNKSRLMYVFKQLSSGNITTYTNVSLKDANDIRCVSAA